jgi:hypothetical protein
VNEQYIERSAEIFFWHLAGQVFEYNLIGFAITFGVMVMTYIKRSLLATGAALALAVVGSTASAQGWADGS